MQPKQARIGLESNHAFADTTKQQNRVTKKAKPDQSSFGSIQPHLGKFRPNGTQTFKRKLDVEDRWQSPRTPSGEAFVEHVPRGREANRFTASGPESMATTGSSPINFYSGMTMNPQPVVRYDQLKSKRIIQSYQIATRIFEEMAGKTTTAYFTPYGDTPDNYVTPYGPPQITLDSGTRNKEGRSGNEAGECQVTPKLNPITKEDGDTKGKNVERMSHTGSQDPEIDEAQIDRLLFLAGGRSVTDDDDTDDDVQVLASFTKAQPDMDVGAIVNRVLGTIASYGFAGK